MRAYLAIKYHPDHRNRPLIERISAVLADSGWETICVVRDLERWGEVSFSAAELMRLSLLEIDRSDRVLVELSEKGVGLGIEAGYARAREIPVVTIATAGADISTTLAGISADVAQYAGESELATVLQAMFPRPEA